MIVVVAEKPSVARDIARVLRCTERGEGYLSGSSHTVTWALGHLVTLCEPDEIDEKYKKWRVHDLPILPEDIPLKVIPKTRKQYQVVKKLICSRETERIICATDAGREGELIFRLIYRMAGCGKPVDRLWISSMTDAAIREGFDALRPGAAYDGLYRSALCRAQADWLVGMNASRAFTLRYGALLSVGRVQTPTLAILAARAREIKAFVPETYFTLTADFGDYKGQWFNPADANEKVNNRIKTKEEADAIAKAVRKQEAEVAEVVREQKRELPPLLYDLTSLQQDANKRFGFTASRTLKAAQSLYESRKCITYPRTDSRHLPDDMAPQVDKAVRALPEAYRAIAEGIQRTGGQLPSPRRMYDAGKVTDHHAIIPTPQKVNLDALSADERQVYDLVVRRFLAGFYPAHEYEALRIVTAVSDHRFRTTGRTVLKAGWKDAYPPGDQEEAPLPNVKQGDRRLVESAQVKKETTKPPPQHTEASLLSAMEHAGRSVEDEELREAMKGSGLGTPATRAAIIDRLIQVGYAVRQGKSVAATEKGISLIEVVPDEIASPEMTAKWEKALDDIAAGGQGAARFMEGIRRFTEFIVSFAEKEGKSVVFEKDTGGAKRRAARRQPAALEGVICPLCGAGVVENDKAFGCAAWQKGCAFTLWKDALTRSKGPVLNAAIVKKLLSAAEVQGSTGLIRLQEGMLSFIPNGERVAACSVPIRYIKKEKRANR